MDVKEIDKFKTQALEYNYKVHETNNSIFVNTGKATWWLDYSNDQNIKLWHKNIRLPNTKGKIQNNYHLQLNHIKDLTQIIIYIHNHDKNKYTSHEKGKYMSKITHMNNLFAQI